MKVLVIAPEIDGLPKLAQTSELTRLGDVPGIDVPQPLIGRLVTPERIQQRLRSGYWDAVVWPGHGHNGRLLMPDGRDIEPRWMASEMRRAKASLLVLSVCESGERRGVEGWSDVLPPAGIHLVAMTADISDTSAVDYDVALFHALACGDSIREAHRIGIEAIQDLPSKTQPQLWVSEPASVNDLAARSEALKQAMAAGQSDDALAIVHQCKTILGEIETHLGGLDGRVTAIERRINPPWQVRFWQGLAAFVVAVAASLFFVYQVREVLFDPWYIGAAFETTLLALALLCWRMAIVTLERMT